MKRFRFAVFTAWVLALLLLAADATHAKTLRWAGRGDVGSMDPHSFNEGFSRAVNGHVYEQLVRLDRQLRHTPGLAERWEVVNETTWVRPSSSHPCARRPGASRCVPACVSRTARRSPPPTLYFRSSARNSPRLSRRYSHASSARRCR